METALSYYTLLSSIQDGSPTVSIHMDSAYTLPLILKSFQSCPFISWTILPSSFNAKVCWNEYEHLDWKRILKGEVIANAYCVRKGLSRKAQLSKYMDKYTYKHPTCALSKAIPTTVVIDTWAAYETQNEENMIFRMTFKQRLQACLWEAEQFMESSSTKTSSTFILKPSCSNKGAEVYILREFKELKDLVLEWPDIREWVLQAYIERPLLVRNRKFHIRTYVLALGSLQVFVYQDMLVLTATEPYTNAPLSHTHAHLTNTAHQVSHPDFNPDDCVFSLDELPNISSSKLPDGFVSTIKTKINTLVGELFDAYKGEFAVFQPLPNCFELYGLDFMIDTELNTWLLEVNPGPDFKQTGKNLQNVIGTLMTDTVNIISQHYFNESSTSNSPLVLGNFNHVYTLSGGYRNKQTVQMEFIE